MMMLEQAPNPSPRRGFHTYIYACWHLWGRERLIKRYFRKLGAQIILGNTFHLWLRPGLENIKKSGGLHQFISWNKPILSDSGGFKYGPLRNLSKLSSDGVYFQSPVSGEKLFLSPERSIEIQNVLNTDIAMVFDECTSWPVDYDDAASSMRLSIDWARRSYKVRTQEWKQNFWDYSG